MKFAMSGFVAGKGFSYIEYTHPVVSAAQANDVDVLITGIEYDVEFENTDNKAISLNQKITDHGNRKTLRGCDLQRIQQGQDGQDCDRGVCTPVLPSYRRAVL